MDTDMRKSTPAFRFDPHTGEYLCATNAEESPLEPDVYLFPAHTTPQPPPAPVSGKAIVWNGTAWAQVEDHRGCRIWLKETGEAGEITAVGPVPAEVTTIARPSARHVWRDDGWVVDPVSLAAWLREQRRLAVVAVDGRAEVARLRFLTPGAGMAAVYEAKRREAIDFSAGSGAGALIEFPLLDAEAARTGQTRTAIAAIWRARAEAWPRIAALIETARLDAKHAIVASADEATITSAVVAFDAALDALPAA